MEEQLTESEILKQRNIANNASNIQNLVDVASKTANPYAKAAGTAIKVADKLSGGKASMKLGKALNTANKFSPGGSLLQKVSNKMAESGTSSRISSALNKKNSSVPVAAKANKKNNAVAEGKDNSFLDKKEVEDQTSDGSEATLKATASFIKVGLMAFAPVMVVFVFLGLIVAGIQTYVSIIGLGQADAVSAEKADEAIRKNGSEGLEDENDDENVDQGSAGNLTYYIEFNDVFIDDDSSVNLHSKKLNKANFIALTKEREFNEADLRELEDFYSDINSYKSQGYDMNTVYKFFFKLYYIQKHYNASYDVELDMPLIMAIVTRQSNNMSEVFISNIKGYKITAKENNEKFKIDHNFFYYSTSKNNSSYDIEILAQNMVAQTEETGCNTNHGACYKIKDSDEYKEFLREFLRQKYYNNSQDSSVDVSINNMITEIYDTKQQYEDLVGDYIRKESIVPGSNKLFWWPIGSKETEEINGILYAKGEPQSISITSNYGSKESFRTSGHGGIDIGNAGNGPGVLNIIAVKAGEVIYPKNDSQTMYDDDADPNDGGGYGNYVVIKHSDGTYTWYGHLAKNSILVRNGDVVDQGQVIGKMGNSGHSTATHLHFEVRLGSNSKSDRTYPLEYVDPNNPRPMSYGSGNSFSLTTTTLSKEEFVARMNDYYERTNKRGFYNNFVLNSEEIYDVCLANNINPELVVVTAGTEQNWTLSAACQYTNNYWGIGITNGKGCNSGGKYDSLAEGIAAYAKVLSSYSEYGSYAQAITNRYNERATAGCDPSGHGLPGTLEGMQSIYSWIGNYRYNPGNSGLGGCYYFDYMYGKSYCTTVPTCAGTSGCSEESRTTTCEQNDYTAWQLRKKAQLRYDIFGL